MQRSIRLIIAVVVCSCLLVGSAALLAQQKGKPSTSEPPTTTIRKNTRLVLVDVVITDKKGNPVTGLQRDDLTLLDEGAAQSISVFEEHGVAQSETASPAAEPLPTGEFTNVPATKEDSSVDVLLFDTLNSSTQDQIYAKQSLLGFLKEAPAGRRMAIFELGIGLSMVQGFTKDKALLLAAAEKLTPGRSVMFADANSREEEDEMLAWMEAAIQDAERAAEFRRSVMDARSQVADQRVELTLEHMEKLARALAGYRGRKNLIWLSSGFPMTIGPDLSARNPLENVRSFGSRARATATMMADAQIAIYPVDSRGLSTNVSSVSLQPLPTPGRFSRQDPQKLAEQQTQRSDDDYSARSSMGELAEQTGGKVFLNTSDLKQAMVAATAMPYYTLAYSPANSKWDGKFRRIEVKARTKGVKLSYRKGYFAVADGWQTPAEEMNQNLVTALQPASPDSTALLVHVKLQETPERPGVVQVQYSVDARGLSLTDSADGGKGGVLDFVAVAWKENNRSAAKTIQVAKFNIKSSEMVTIMRDGVRFSHELALDPGTYNLRLGVMDRNSGRIGTLMVPITIAKTR